MVWKFDANRIRLAREARDMSQADLAMQIGAAAQQVSLWETGHVSPGQDSLIKIINALGVAPRFFYVQTAQNGNESMTDMEAQ